MITLADYYRGHDVRYRHLLGSDLRANAARTVEAANALLILAKGAGIVMRPNKDSGMVRSGWRPPAVNAVTPHASRTSLHMQCLAVDIEDETHALALWAMANADTVLRDLALWLEHPTATSTWCHVQLRPPDSGNRVFIP